MPWCEPCGKFYSPNTLNPDGTCPQRHQVGDPGRGSAARGSVVDTSDAPRAEESAKVPWHFWLLAFGVAVYLGWRFVQLIVWMF